MYSHIYYFEILLSRNQIISNFNIFNSINIFSYQLREIFIELNRRIKLLNFTKFPSSSFILLYELISLNNS